MDHASCLTGATLTELGLYYITLRDPHNSSDNTSAYSIIVNFSYFSTVASETIVSNLEVMSVTSVKDSDRR